MLLLYMIRACVLLASTRLSALLFPALRIFRLCLISLLETPCRVNQQFFRTFLDVVMGNLKFPGDGSGNKGNEDANRDLREENYRLRAESARVDRELERAQAESLRIRQELENREREVERLRQRVADQRAAREARDREAEAKRDEEARRRKKDGGPSGK